MSVVTYAYNFQINLIFNRWKNIRKLYLSFLITSDFDISSGIGMLFQSFIINSIFIIPLYFINIVRHNSLVMTDYELSRAFLI